MIIHDDASMETVVQKSVSCLKEIARHIGKADRSMSADQIQEVEKAVVQLQQRLDMKTREFHLYLKVKDRTIRRP